MNEERIYLNVPPDATEYAERFGAIQDASGKWFYRGVLPRELTNFLPRAPNPFFYEREPFCPVCGALMRKVSDPKSGDLLWLCSSRMRSGCKGSIRYEDYLQRIEPLRMLGDFLPKCGTLLLPASIPTKRKKTSESEKSAQKPQADLLRERRLLIAEKAVKALGNLNQVTDWLTQPKVALGFKTPIQVLGSEEGCAKVAKLLDELWD